MGWKEGEARHLAGQSHGLIDRGTVLAIGGSDDSIQRLVAGGSWRRLHPGVYYLNVTDPTWHANLQAAVLAAGPEARASHRSAGKLWGLDGFRTQMLEVTVPYTKLPEPKGVTLHRTRRALPGETIEDVRVTTVERTILDLAGLLPERPLEKALRSAIRLRLTTIDRVAQTASEQGGRGVRGTRRLRRALINADHDATGSPSEVDLISLIRTAPIPQPICQFNVRLPDGSNALPDFTWPDLGKFVEADGFEAHGTPEAMERDLIRQNQLLELGWQMRRYSAALIRRDPQGVLRDIVRFIRSD